MAYLFLVISIIGELIGTSMLKASEGFTKLYPSLLTIVAFIISFLFISLTLKTLPLNMTYAIWAGAGAVATALISVLIWKEKLFSLILIFCVTFFMSTVNSRQSMRKLLILKSIGNY